MAYLLAGSTEFYANSAEMPCQFGHIKYALRPLKDRFELHLK